MINDRFFEIRVLFIMEVSFTEKQVAKESCLRWSPDLKSWYGDIIFSNLREAKQFIQNENDLKFDHNGIYKFKLKAIIESRDYLNADDFLNLTEKFMRKQNNYNEKQLINKEKEIFNSDKALKKQDSEKERRKMYNIMYGNTHY